MKLHELTIHELQQKLRSGETTAVDLVESVIGRIDEVEDKTRSYITVLRNSAREEAFRADEEIRQGKGDHCKCCCGEAVPFKVSSGLIASVVMLLSL